MPEKELEFPATKLLKRRTKATLLFLETLETKEFNSEKIVISFLFIISK